jgi:hypothetical protein
MYFVPVSWQTFSKFQKEKLSKCGQTSSAFKRGLPLGGAGSAHSIRSREASV